MNHLEKIDLALGLLTEITNNIEKSVETLAEIVSNLSIRMKDLEDAVTTIQEDGSKP